MTDKKVAPKKTATKKPVAKVKPTELAVVQKLTLDNFNKVGAIKPVVDAIKEHYAGLVFDMTTKEGRTECTTTLKEMKANSDAIFSTRKSIADDIKQLPKIVDAEGKYALDELTKFIAEVGQPLTEWKAKEKAKKLQKQIEADREVALGMMETFFLKRERDEMFIEKGEAFLKAEADFLAQEEAKKAVADGIAAQKLATENAQLLQKQAEKDAEKAKAANQKIKDDAAAAQLAWEAGQADRDEQARLDEIKRCVDANYSSLATYDQNIRMCQSFEILEQNSGIFAGLKVCDYGYIQEKADALIRTIEAKDTELRNRFSNEAKQRELEALARKVSIVFPNEVVEKTVMNHLINAIDQCGLLWKKVGKDTLNVTEQVVIEQAATVDQSEWDLQ